MIKEGYHEICEDDDNGIVKWIARDEEYTFWTHADYIKPCIIDFLKEMFPGKLIVRELNKIDLSIPEDNLPIEIQATNVNKIGGNNPSYSTFEKEIEKGINQNIISYGICWLFFDSELLRAMKNASKQMSINMVWFRSYMKEGKLKVFTVRYDGIIEEKQYKDFDFLSEISQTCSIAAKTDGMILNENKLKIYANVVNMYGFTQNEIDKFYDDWSGCCGANKINSVGKNDGFEGFLSRQKGLRPKLYCSILNAINNLSAINDILGLKSCDRRSKSRMSVLGVFAIEGSTTNAITRFVNRSNICQYIPGYMKNKETWEKLKGHSLNARQFENIVKNGIGNYFWYEEDKNSIAVESDKVDFESNCEENSNTTNDEKTDKGKDVNIEIKNKDQIITINIKKTKQINIDEAWE